MATKDDILESISNMTVIELKELLDAFEEKFEVTAAAPVAVAAAGAPAGGGDEPAAEEKSEFDVVLQGGRVLDPETGLDAVRDVGIRGTRIAELAASGLVPAEATGRALLHGELSLDGAVRPVAGALAAALSTAAGLLLVISSSVSHCT